MSSTKYFHAGNATRTYRIAGHMIKFEPSGRNGSVWEGILETDDQQVIDGLKKLESEGGLGIREVEKSVYDDIKKKAVSLRSQNLMHQIQAPAFARPDQQAAVPRVAVADNFPPQQPAPEPEKSVDDFLSTGLVSEREGEESQAPKRKRKSK
jgi:hypothetical protein